MDPGLARGLELYLHLAHQAPLAQYDYEDADLSEEEQDAIIGKLEKKISQMENQLQRANAEISGLKKELHNTKKEADSSRIKLDMAMSEAAEQTQELADLRELIFRQANEHLEDQEQSEPTQIIFPYQVKRHYTVFGGHETWLKAIKPMLPNVIFIPKGQQPQASLIRNQDAIWIQANAISHADFYKIINVIRANHIPVYYFGFASAQKCATQLAEEDTKISG